MGVISAEKEVFPQVGEIFKPQHQLFEKDGGMPLNIFAIPWGHHRTIIDRYENEPTKALFYATKTLEHSWSRAVLENMMGDKGKDNRLSRPARAHLPRPRHEGQRLRCAGGEGVGVIDGNI